MDIFKRGIIFLSLIYCGQCLTLISKFSLNGVTGSVTFIQDNGDTTVNFNLTGLKNANTFHIRSVRMLYDRQDRCSDSVLGTDFVTLNGTIGSNGVLSTTILSGDLPKLSSLTGRTLLLVDSSSSERTCAPIETGEDHITAIAKLRFVVGGTVIFRQSISQPSATSILYNVFHLDNTGTASTENVIWQIFSGTVSESASCSNVGNIYDPISSKGTPCDTDNQNNCAVGDLSSKNMDLSVGVTNEAALKTVVDHNLPLSGSNSIINKILVLKAQNGTVLTCAKIVQYQKRRAITRISRERVTGTVAFEQMSPLDPAMVSVDLTGLNGQAGGYHIHKWPVPEKWSLDQPVCGGDYVSGHFNPFSIDTNTDPAPTVGTTDQYEVGDLSSKFGLLDGLTEKSENYTDFNVQLFGINSVIGRSIVVHFVNGSRWVCATIEYVGNTVTGVAMFTYPVIGHIVFKQPTDVDLELADTSVYTSLNYGQSSTRTVDHKWHVHTNTIVSDDLLSSGRCLSVQGHYNPYSVDLHGNYNLQCYTNNPLRCETGDLSGKHGKIAIRSSTSGIMQRNFFTDFDLPLWGELKILGRSVVIHDANSGGGRLSCANIYTIPNRKVIVKAGTWADETASNVDGSFSMERSTEGLIAGTTSVDIQLSGLASTAGGYHVHVYPVPEGSSNPCSPSSVGGHFNPFGVDPTAGPVDGSGSDDEYEIGDLSRKYGDFLNDRSSFTAMKKDTMLPLRGPLSITGRSVVIHKSTSGAPRWVCGNINEDASTGGTLYEAKVSFDTGAITGYIYMRQYQYSDGGLSDTSVLIDLKNNDGSTTTGHKWHVHENPVGDDATSGCLSTGNHFNPFMVDTTSYDECSPINPLRCELGDQAKKLGQYDIGSGRKFFTDVNLPLVGPYGVAGRSFVIHAENGGNPRVACADIMPVTTISYTLTFQTQSVGKSSIVGTLATALNTMRSNLAVTRPSNSTSTDCMSVTVYFTGKDATSLQSHLRTMVSNGDPKLGSFAETTTCCSCTNVVSIFLIFLAIVIQIISTKS